MISYTSTLNVVELSEWCREYHRETPYPVPYHVRYGIGIYQIYQGMSWSRGPASVTTASEYESFAASSIHFICACQALDIDIWPHLPKSLLDIKRKKMDWRKLMWLVGGGQRHIVYKFTKSTTRNKRFASDNLAAFVSESVEMLFGVIPKKDRRKAILDATSVMTGRL